jgi:hypothetical protein
MKVRNVTKIQLILVPKFDAHRQQRHWDEILKKLEIASIVTYEVDQHYCQEMGLCGAMLFGRKKALSYLPPGSG